jgi:NAD+ synthase
MGELRDDLKFEPEHVCEAIGRFLREWSGRLERDGIVIGISGGVDSAVAAALVCRTMGPDFLLGLILPDRDSDPQSERHARILSNRFGFRVRKQCISPALKRLGVYDIYWPSYYLPRWVKLRQYTREKARHEREPGTIFFETRLSARPEWLRRFSAYHLAKVRMRLVALYMAAELENRLVVGTTNYTEWMTGWFAKWGDSVADVSPLTELYKTQVWELATHLGVPDEIVRKPPSPDLVVGLYDEDGLGMPYRAIDLVLAGINRGLPAGEIARQTGLPLERAAFVQDLIRRTDHMRRLPPYPQLTIGKRIHSSSEMGPEEGKQAPRERG